MSNKVLQNQIKSKLSKITLEENVIVVLKGIPISAVIPEEQCSIDLEQLVKNKISYLLSIFGIRTFITYEEFLLMNNLILDQYKRVYILNNNIYMDQYPIDAIYSEGIKNGLLNHFSESDEDDDTFIGDIDEYISMYEGIKEYNGYLLGTYCEAKIQNSNKLIYVNLFDEIDTDIVHVSDAVDIIDIGEESDYIDVVKKIFHEPEEINLRISNYSGDIIKLKNHINILAEYWKEFTDVYCVQATKTEEKFEKRNEYKELLKKYWGFENFLTLPVYDMSELENGKKVVREVSQEDIISNLVQQVENCADENKDFRDIFVTAPTGAGKSIMFQIPAIYLAEKEEKLLTIVISPLIGLMNDQVKNLEIRNYKGAKTINSDISPIIKQDIIERVNSNEYHILYISPETLLSRSDVEQLIGNRTIGMIIIDEAHIVTTWGKQFRPDYWYLGDHIKKLRKKQLQNKEKGRSFVVATFTATAIYRGIEDMYNETVNSLHMIDPITYLGYVKRNDINIVIENKKKDKGTRTEYELDKFKQIEKLYKRVMITNKKTLVYFPTVSLINRCYEYLRNKHMKDLITIYHGSLSKDEKVENYERFVNKEKPIMLATKAFGMGIDINDIEIVNHFAPTGNVCDYVQEIGRAARKKELTGEALYQYDPRDFKHINRLHGLSTIQRYQLIEVVKKIDELYQQNLRRGKFSDFTKKRNAMLLDAENFTYIFGTPISDEDNNINKVKTALLIIQKDFENKVGFSPITVRPVPMFSIGFFEIDSMTQSRILNRYPGSIEEIDSSNHICRVILSQIWSKDFRSHSFPKFKYMLYTKDKDLDFTHKYPVRPALCVSIAYAENYMSTFGTVWGIIKAFIHKKVLSSEHAAVEEIVEAVTDGYSKFTKYKARAVCEVIIASMDSFRKKYAKSSTPIATEKTTTAGITKYQFNVAVNSYFSWVEKIFNKIVKDTKDGKLYLITENGTKTKEYAVVLGILEALDVLSFEMIGGANSQIYIYINQIQSLKNILNAPYNYNNRLLDMVADRHLISVKMLTYIYEGGYSNEEIWSLIEDYFLGTIPEKVKRECKRVRPSIDSDD